MPEDQNLVDQSKYPAGQAPRGLGQTDIKAAVSREREVMGRNDPTGSRFRPTPYGTRPAPPKTPAEK